MKKLFRKLHLWLSVPFGVIVTLVCFSGAMLVFEDEVMRLSRHDLFYVEQVGRAPLPVGEVARRAAATLPDGVKVSSVNVPSDPARTWQVALSRPKRAWMAVDPYTGEVKGRYERAPFFQVMFRLHRWLLDSARPDGGPFWGKIIVGTSTLVFVVVLLTGVVLWWPRKASALRRSLSITARRGWRRFWYDLHVAGGMYALVLLLAMGLTGLTWSFDWYRTAFYAVFGVETTRGGGHGNHGERESRPERHTHFEHWQKVYDQLAAANPDFRQINVSDGSATVAFDRLGNQRAADRYTFDRATGRITSATPYSDTPASGKIRGWIYSVHVGSWGGTLTRVLSFLAALLGASLPLTGYYLWIKRLRRRPHTPSPNAPQR